MANQSESVGVSLAEGRVACSVAGAVAGRGGACPSRIHSGGAIDLDSFSPGEEGGGGGLRVNTSATGGGGEEGAIERGREGTGSKRCLEGWIHHQC